MNRGIRRRMDRSRGRSRRIIGASVIAIGGLAAGYLQVLRQAPAAYANGTPCIPVTNNSSWNSAAAYFNSGGCSTITIADNWTVTPSPSLTVIDFTNSQNSLTIDGNGKTISAAGYRPITVKGMSLTDALEITSLTINGASSIHEGLGFDDGGAISINGNSDDTYGSVTFESVTVTDSTACTNDGGSCQYYQAAGGGAYIRAGDVFIANSTFTDDTANYGGAISLYASQGPITVVNSTFNTNSAIDDSLLGNAFGGGVHFSFGPAADDSNAQFSDDTFAGNIAQSPEHSEGGGISASHSPGISGYLRILDSSFTGNLITGESQGFGAAVALYGSPGDSVYVSGSRFTTNEASGAYSGGGAVASSGPARIAYSTFSGNSIHADVRAYGGALYVRDTLDVGYSSIIDNQAVAPGQGLYGIGGGVVSHGSTRVTNSYIGGNYATTVGGGLVSLDDVELYFSTLYDDTVPGNSYLELYSLGALKSWGSAVGNQLDGAVMMIVGPIDDTDSVCTGEACGFDDTVAAGGLGLGSLDDTVTPGHGGRTPLAGSILIDGAPSRTTAYAWGILPQSLDQVGVDRTSYDSWTIGARQVTSTSHTVTFHANGGSGSMAAQSSAAGATLSRNAFRRPGYTFVGWATSPTGSVAYSNGAYYDFAADLDLYARWRINPPPATPPGPPRQVTGVPGDRQVAVSWLPPTDPGTSPVIDYQVIASPGAQSCTAVAPAVTCTVTGLTNGVSYTFAVTARSDAGRGPDAISDPVTPDGPTPARWITLTKGSRTHDGRHDKIQAAGDSHGIAPGTKLTPYIRFKGQTQFTEGAATITVRADGTFTWSRQIRKDRGIAVYVAYQDVHSNTVYWKRIR